MPDPIGGGQDGAGSGAGAGAAAGIGAGALLTGALRFGAVGAAFFGAALFFAVFFFGAAFIVFFLRAGAALFLAVFFLVALFFAFFAIIVLPFMTASGETTRSQPETAMRKRLRYAAKPKPAQPTVAAGRAAECGGRSRTCRGHGPPVAQSINSTV